MHSHSLYTTGNSAATTLLRAPRRRGDWPARACLAVVLLLTPLLCYDRSITRAPAWNGRDLSGLSAAQPAATEQLFPRLANYNGFSEAADVPAYQHDGLVIAQQWIDAGRSSPVAQLEQADPSAMVLVYQRMLQVDYPFILQLYGEASIFPGWWLLRAGSVLTAPLNATQTTITVADPQRFQRYDDVLVDGETMHVLAIRGSTLTVQRGFFSQAAAHRVGTRVAAHYSYRVDLANSIIGGPRENRRPWSFNLSSRCPRDPLGRTWDDFLAARMAQLVKQGHWRGVFFDNTDQLPRDPAIDVNDDNLPDGGIIQRHNTWRDGEMYLLHRFHALAPSALIMYNGTLDAGLAANGREMEQFPVSSGLYMSDMSDYFYWERHSSQPDLNLVNPDSGRSPRPDLNAMRFGLASALLGNGFYSYDEGWHRHGVVWNFDEYDDGAGSAVLHDVGVQDTYIRVRDTFKFHSGDTVLVGREEMKVRDLGNWNLIVQRGINGTRATTHPAGSVIATPDQIAAGSGYLGQAVGAPFPLLRAAQGPNVIANGSFLQQTRHWNLSYAGPIRTPVAYEVLWTGAQPSGGSRAAKPVTSPSGLRDARGFQVEVPWQPLGDPGDISLAQGGIAVQPSTPYTLTFWARGTPGMSWPVVITGRQSHGPPRYATYVLTVHQGWYQYTLDYMSAGDVRRVQISFLFGHAPGANAVTGVSLQRGQSLVFARRFSHGLAVLNQGDTAQVVTLPGTFWHLRGDQDPAVNNGQPVRQLWLRAQSGIVLLNAPPAN